MFWEKARIDIGNSIVGIRRRIEFHSTENIPKIKSIISSCGCSTPSYDESKKILTVKYKPQPIPKHLEGTRNFYSTTKYITVTYIDGRKDVLSFTTKVIG